MRCLALGQSWREAGGTVYFLGSMEGDALRERFFDEGIEVHNVVNPWPHKSDLRQLCKVLTNNKGKACLALDGYHFDIAYQRQAKKLTSKLLLIDDYNHLSHYSCDVLLNQNLNAELLHYTFEGTPHLLLGPKFALLRREIVANGRIKNTQQNFLRTILVSCGGSDPSNATLLAIQALSQLQMPELQIIVVVGPAYPHGPLLRTTLNKIACQVEVLVNVRDMGPLLRQADLAVVAAGSSCLEMAYFGVPMVAMIVAENQVELANGLEKAGAAKIAGWRQNLSANTLAAIIRNLLAERSALMALRAAGEKLVDGLGAVRVRDCLLGLAGSGGGLC